MAKTRKLPRSKTAERSRNSRWPRPNEQYVKKGTPLLIVGKIQTRQYQDNAGQTRYVTEIVVEEMELLGAKKPEQAPAPEPDYRPTGDYRPMGVLEDMPAGI